MKKRGQDRRFSSKKADDQYSVEPAPRKFPTIYPTVNAIIEPHEMSAGQFIGSRPQGITVHYTADRDIDRVLKSLRERNLGYHLIIGRDGKVIQTCYLDRRTNHAGPSEWRNLGCNRWHVAVALVSWGQLDKQRRTWVGKPLPDADVAMRKENISGKQSYWDKATPEQEDILVQILSWFIAHGVDPRHICGHDEAAVPPGRKVDPGGVLPWRMEDLRNTLCNEAGLDP